MGIEVIAPMQDAPVVDAVHRRPLSTRLKAVIVAVGAGVLALGVLLGVLVLSNQKSPIPQSIAEKALYETYYPARLPKGYELDEDSFVYNEGALIFSASSDDGKTLAFTETAVPQDFDMNKFNEGLKNAKRLVGLPVQAITGQMPGQRTVLSMVHSGTWILVTLRGELSEADMRLIAANLRS